MKALSDLIVALASLVEAEVNHIRRSLFRLHVALSLIVAGCILALGGLATMLYALFLYLTSSGLSPAGSALVTGLIVVLVALPVLGIAIWLSR